MKIAITGTSGFIGKRFLELYRNEFLEVVELNRKNAPLDQLALIIENTKGVDVLVHTAFDHYYQFNQIGLDNIISACKINGIKKLVFISTVSVYNQALSGNLNEHSPYSAWLEPYSVEKQKLEQKLEEQPFSTIILQPTIVYGIGGSWTNFAINACKHKSFSIPNPGAICNAVYVDDVAQSIFRACLVDGVEFGRFLISSSTSTTWKEFYVKHNQLLANLKLPNNLSFSQTQNNFHNNTFINAIFSLWYKTPVGHILNLFIKQIKLLREKKQPRVITDFKKLIAKDLLPENTSVIGITRQVHNCNFNVEINKAQNILGYVPLFSFEKGVEDMEKKLNNG